jgi:hypothetical protein
VKYSIRSSLRPISVPGFISLFPRLPHQLYGFVLWNEPISLTLFSMVGYALSFRPCHVSFHSPSRLQRSNSSLQQTYSIQLITTSVLCHHHSIEIQQSYDIFLVFPMFLMNFRKKKEKEKLISQAAGGSVSTAKKRSVVLQTIWAATSTSVVDTVGTSLSARFHVIVL